GNAGVVDGSGSLDEKDKAQGQGVAHGHTLKPASSLSQLQHGGLTSGLNSSSATIAAAKKDLFRRPRSSVSTHSTSTTGTGGMANIDECDGDGDGDGEGDGDGGEIHRQDDTS
ncbi:hypothetical protein KEM52_003971, partial [Ascosphaera acerosa]